MCKLGFSGVKRKKEDMREILFRGKRLDNGEWMEGYYAIIGKRNVIIKNEQENFYSVDENLKKSQGNEIVKVNPETVCQYTGLTDKNGNKIWEGDIVKEVFGLYKAVIRFGEFENQILKNIGFNLDWSSRVGYRQDLPYWTDKVEVIGNIFDNPERMEVG